MNKQKSYRGDGSFQITQEEYERDVLWWGVKALLVALLIIGAVIYSAVRLFV